MSFLIYSCKTGKCLNQIFFTGSWPGFKSMKKDLWRIGYNTLTCDFTLFPGKNSLNIAKSSHIFHRNGRGDKTLILTYLGSPMAEIFVQYCLFWSILAIFKGKRGIKTEPKVLTLGQSLLHKNLNTSKHFK